ncbi:MAG: putative Ig domain-containing protein [Planctomycetota bacterium]
MYRLLRTLIVILALAFIAAGASAATYYVATDGNDVTGDGSSGNPWATLQHAVDTISNGDTILVKPGTYDGCRIRYSGASGSPKTLAAETAGTVLVNTPGALCRRPSTIEIISEDHGSSPTDYWTIEGFEVTGGKWGIDGIECGHITVRNNVVHDNGWATGSTGIHLAYGDYQLVENNTSYYNGEHGIYCNNGADYGVIRGNAVYDNASMGVHMNGDGDMPNSDGIMTDWLVEKNVSYDNGTNGFDGDGTEYTTWRNNLAYNNGSKGIHLFCYNGDVQPQYLNIYNNTIHVPVGAYYCVNFYRVKKNANLPGGHDNKIKNNILYNADITNSMRGSLMYITQWTSGWESDYNVVVNRFGMDDNKTKYTLAEWQTAWGQDMNSTLELDDTAIFTDQPNGDYTLKTGSPAIDAGTTISSVTDDIEGTSRPQGSAYDCGCYEAAGGPPPDLEITTTSLPNGQVTVAYSETLQATGGVTPYTWSIISGSLPAGLSLTASTGEISGTPTTEETANFTVQVTDSQEPADTDTQALSITIDPEPSGPTITTTSLPDGTRKVDYSAYVEATGGTLPYTWSIVSGSLPTGLGLNSSTGEISGNPKKSETKNFTVRCTDDASQWDEQALSITINP